ncbi:MAG: homogentisate 1,2-dioxygenase, partial [Jatrophihabitantaceae bacterium]
MAYYHRVGAVPPKRHTQHRAADGALYFEELMGEEGFSSDSSLLYHRNIPSAITEVRSWQLPDQSTAPNSPLKPMHLVLPQLFEQAAPAELDPVTGRRLVLGNTDVRISYAVAGKASPFYRNAIGDECVFV